MSLWYVYIVRCADTSLYTGITINLKRRIWEHNGGVGAKYTKAKRPVTLLYHESVKNRSRALKREWAIKKLSKQEKEDLTKTP